MARLGLIIPDEMEEALKQESEKTSIPISALVRIALENLLTEKGYEVKSSVSWGGRRKSPQKDSNEE